MATSEQTSMQPPGPDPALKALDMFVGTWRVTGRTLGADEDNVAGTLRFEWLPGGIFLQQHDEIDGRAFTIRTELAGGATYTGSFSTDGGTASGGWRPNPGAEGPGNTAYD